LGIQRDDVPTSEIRTHSHSRKTGPHSAVNSRGSHISFFQVNVT
jgi:hypothetical protein